MYEFISQNFYRSTRIRFLRLCTITILPGLFNHLHDLRCDNTAFESTMYK